MKRAFGSHFLKISAALFWVLLISGCELNLPLAQSSPAATVSPLPSSSPSLTPSITPSPSPLPAQGSPTPSAPLPLWGSFPGPSNTSATALPPPMPALDFPEEARAVILAGLDRPDPYPGRSDALMLLIYHPRLSKAALISIPPDLFGYLPGQSMQRLYSAYPLGGARLLQQTIEYNLGIRPNAWLVIHNDDFSLLIDELGGLTIPVLEDIPNVCGDILYQGDVNMDGQQVLCYARLRLGTDEAARGLRQQQILSLLLQRMVSGGNLAKLPELYSLFHSRIDTNLTTADALEAIPLGLRLGDPNRVAYFKIGQDQTDLWQISKQPPATVFLPKREEIRALLQSAIEFINKPSPLSDVVLTLEVQLTTSPTLGTPGTPTEPPPTRTPRPQISQTAGPTVTSTPTRTSTATITPTPTLTPTITNTFSP